MEMGCATASLLLICLIFLPVAIVGAGLTSPVWGYHYYRYNKIIKKWYNDLPASEQAELDRVFGGRVSAGKLKKLYANINPVMKHTVVDEFKFFKDARLITPFRGTSNDQKIINVLEYVRANKKYM